MTGESLNIGSAIDDSRSSWATALSDLVADDERWSEQADAFAAPKQVGRGGHPPLDDDTVKMVAKVYITALAQNLPTNETVASHFHLSRSGADKRIRIARERGFLPPARGALT